MKYCSSADDAVFPGQTEVEIRWKACFSAQFGKLKAFRYFGAHLTQNHSLHLSF